MSRREEIEKIIWKAYSEMGFGFLAVVFGVAFVGRALQTEQSLSAVGAGLLVIAGVVLFSRGLKELEKLNSV